MAKLKFTLCKVIEIGATGDQTCHDSSRQSVPHGRPLNQCCYRQERILQDIMTPLCALLSSYSQDWGPADSSHPPKTEKQKVLAQKIDSKTEIFIESVNLLWNLCEACPLALNIVNEKQILPFLLNHLVSCGTAILKHSNLPRAYDLLT